MARLNPKERKEQILVAAVKLAEREGYANIRRDDVASAANVSAGLVNQYFKTMLQLRRAIVRRAVHSKNIIIIGQALANKDKATLKIPEYLKKQALDAYFNNF